MGVKGRWVPFPYLAAPPRLPPIPISRGATQEGILSPILVGPIPLAIFNSFICHFLRHPKRCSSELEVVLRIGLDLSQNGYGWNYNAYREEHLSAYHAYRKEQAYNAYREEHLSAYNAFRKEHAYNAYREEHLSAYKISVRRRLWSFLVGRAHKV